MISERAERKPSQERGPDNEDSLDIDSDDYERRRGRN